MIQQNRIHKPITQSEISHRQVLRIAVPMTLAFLSTPLLGLVDTMVIGQLGSAQLLGGIAIGAILCNFIFTIFNFLGRGTTALTAQAVGARNQPEIAGILGRTLLLATIAGVAIIALNIPLREAGIALMGGSTEVNNATATYFNIRIFSAPFVFANYAILGWHLGQGRAGIGLVLLTILNVTNMALSVLLVIGLGWSIAGVAWATVISEILTLSIGLFLIWRHYGRVAIAPFALIINRARLAKLLAVNRDIMMRTMALLFVLAFFTSEGARQGDLILAANAVLMNFFLFAGFFLDGFAVAAEQLVGSSIGAHARSRAVRAISLSVTWGFALGAVTSVCLYLTGPVIINFVTISPEIREAALIYLPWAAATPVVGALAFELDGAYIGATWSREMRNWMLASVAISAIVWWSTLPLLGNHGLWLALLVFLAARGITLALRLPFNLKKTFSENKHATTL